MTVPFGFSIGDFVAGIGLVRDVIEALQSSSSSTTRYQGLMFELFTLERALLEVKKLGVGDAQATQPERLEIDTLYGALRLTAVQCQNTISRLLGRVKRYEGHLTANGSGSKWKDALRKVQWALLTDKELEEYRAEIRGHAISINMLLTVAQLQATRLRIHHSVSPPLRGTEYGEPILFVDAFGKETRFYIDFVYSAAKIGSSTGEEAGYEKIVNREYVLEDMKTKRQIKFSQDWQTQLYPGMRLGMDMIFQRHQDQLNTCPGCQWEYSGMTDENIECPNCGVHFRRIDELLELESNADSFTNTGKAVDTLPNPSQSHQQEVNFESASRSRSCERKLQLCIKRMYREQEQMRLFRRFRFQPTRAESELAILPPHYSYMIAQVGGENKLTPVIDYQAADQIYRQVFKRFDGNHSLGQPNVLYGLHNLGVVLIIYERFGEAEKIFLRILEEIGGSSRPEDDPLLSRTVNNLAVAKFHQRKYQEAEMLLRRALPNLDLNWRDSGNNLLCAWNNLAYVLQTQNNAGEARDLQERLVEMASVLGNEEKELLKSFQKNLDWILS